MDIIAEIGQAHDGSLGSAHAYIDALAETGVTAVKFQTHIADAESSIHEPFRINFSYEDNTRLEYWKRMEFTEEQWIGLKNHCEECGLEFISSPFSIEAVELLERLNVKRYKIGSGEVTNLLLLEKVAGTEKPIIISSGMSSFEELDMALNYLKSKGNDLCLLQCNSDYPSKPGEWGLNLIKIFKSKYNIPVGFSDHSGDIFACLAAAALGADLLEFHVVFDKECFGPDSSSSITIKDIKRLVQGVQSIVEDLNSNSELFKNSNSKNHMKSIFEKSLAVNKDLKCGHVIQFDDLESKKPSSLGIGADKFDTVVGKKLNQNLAKWDFLKEEFIDD